MIPNLLVFQKHGGKDLRPGHFEFLAVKIPFVLVESVTCLEREGGGPVWINLGVCTEECRGPIHMADEVELSCAQPKLTFLFTQWEMLITHSLTYIIGNLSPNPLPDKS